MALGVKISRCVSSVISASGHGRLRQTWSLRADFINNWCTKGSSRYRGMLLNAEFKMRKREPLYSFRSSTCSGLGRVSVCKSAVQMEICHLQQYPSKMSPNLETVNLTEFFHEGRDVPSFFFDPPLLSALKLSQVLISLAPLEITRAAHSGYLESSQIVS